MNHPTRKPGFCERLLRLVELRYARKHSYAVEGGCVVFKYPYDCWTRDEETKRIMAAPLAKTGG